MYHTVNAFNSWSGVTWMQSAFGSVKEVQVALMGVFKLSHHLSASAWHCFIIRLLLSPLFSTLLITIFFSSTHYSNNMASCMHQYV